MRRRFWNHLEAANAASNPELMRLALKLATGAGKTTVMAMLIAWQTLNAVRHPNAKRFARGFLVVTPGITIKDRLRVLQPNDPDSYFRDREIVPEDMVADMGRAKIVITNYHAFRKKDEVSLNRVQQAALKTTPRPESDGAMIRRVAGELMGLKNIVVLNDEAHHCYRERPLTPDEEAALKGDELAEAKDNNEAARLWIAGLEAVKRELGLAMMYDLSATPFFLKGSGYREGSLFGWVMSDFSLMDAIECGIVKLPRVPIMDNVPGGDTPMFRNLWEHVSKALPKKGRGSTVKLDPQKLPNALLSAIDALYGHYEKTHALWCEAGVGVDPVFIVVCNNTATSKFVHDYIAGNALLPDAECLVVDGRVVRLQLRRGSALHVRTVKLDLLHAALIRHAIVDLARAAMPKAEFAEWQHRAAAWLNAIEAELPPDKAVHVILDNYATHKQPKVRLARPASALDLPLRAHIVFVVERRGGLLRRADPPTPEERRLFLRRRSPGRHQPLHQGALIKCRDRSSGRPIPTRLLPLSGASTKRWNQSTR